MAGNWGSDNDNEAQGQAPPFALRIRNMACNALYRHFAIIEIVLQLFRLSFLLPVPAPLPVHTLYFLLFAFCSFCCFLHSSHIIYVKALDICQPRQHLALIYLLLSHAASAPTPTAAAAVPTPLPAAACAPSFFLVQNKLCHVKSKVTQHSLCWSVCVCVFWEQLLIALVVWELPGERKFCRKFCTLS